LVLGEFLNVEYTLRTAIVCRSRAPPDNTSAEEWAIHQFGVVRDILRIEIAPLTTQNTICSNMGDRIEDTLDGNRVIVRISINTNSENH
jgi:hypothetical protein